MKDFFLRTKSILGIVILILICSVTTLVRIFSVIRYQSIIHEFDPWFNYRTTKFLVDHDIRDLWNFFDSDSWYPLGRNVGATVFPGLMSTSGFIYILLIKIGIPIDIRNICVFLAPVFASLTAISSYLLTTEVTKKSGAGLFAALFIGLAPSYMSRSVAGSYDNEAVAIFALVFSFYTFLKACNTGSILWSVGSAIAYFYMVACWGGYSFIINIIPIFVLFTLITHKQTEEKNWNKMYIAYTIFYILGTLMAMQIPFVKFLAISSSQHMASHGVFVVCQLYMLLNFFKKYVSKKVVDNLVKYLLTSLFIIFGACFIILLFLGETSWSGRSMTLLDPTYAKKYIPIIASVSQHKATTWSAFFSKMHFLIFLTPIGLFYVFKKRTHNVVFIGIYVTLSVYFASVMIRLLLVFAPAASMASGIGCSWLVNKCTKSIKSLFIKQTKQLNKQEKEQQQQFIAQTVQLKPKQKKLPVLIAVIILLLIVYLLHIYVCQSAIVAAQNYSSPSVVSSKKLNNGQRRIHDDFREAYYWLRMNTKENSVIMSWWDYGYQIAGFSNRTTLVDNNTWNNTHIATVGLAMASPENQAYEVADKLDVDYVLVIFGGNVHRSSDDISKFLWMIRIAGGVYPHIKEQNFKGSHGYKTDSTASETLTNSLMYKLSYYRFWQVETSQGKPKGWDTVRNYVPGYTHYKLNFFEQAFSSSRWVVRIFKRKPRSNRQSIQFFKQDQYQKQYETKQEIVSQILQDYKYANKTKE